MAGRRKTAAVAAAVALSCALAACGGGGGTPARPTATPPAVSPSPTDAGPTDRSPRGVMLAAAQGLQSARRAKLSYTMDSPDGKTDRAEGVLFWAPRTIMQLRRTTPGATDQVIVMDTVSYTGGDAATAARLGGRHWQKSAEVIGPDSRKETPFAPLVDQLNPLLAVTAAAGAGDLRLVGQEKIADSSSAEQSVQPVDHYRATISVADYAAAQQDLLTADRRARLAAALGQGGVTVLTLDLWLDDRDQPVRVQRTGQGSDGKLDQVIDYSEFGGQLAVQAPPENDTVDAPAPSPSH